MSLGDGCLAVPLSRKSIIKENVSKFIPIFYEVCGDGAKTQHALLYINST